MGLFILCLFLVVAWGWTLVLLWGLVMIAVQTRGYFIDAIIQRERLWQAVVLFVIAFGWQQATARHNFGITFGEVASQDGKNRVLIRSAGSMRFALLVKYDGRNRTFVFSRRPSHVFWMSSGTEIGVVFPRGTRKIIDVELTFMIDQGRHPWVEWTPAQWERYHYKRRKLSPAECDKFDAELRLAEQRGLVWNSGE